MRCGHAITWAFTWGPMINGRLRGALCACLILAAGCGRREGAEPASAAGEPPSVLRLGNGAEPQDLDPQVVIGVPEHRILMALFSGLAELDPHTLVAVPGLAESWDISPDGLTYTFHLRPNLHWSDGSPLTAEDFIESYRRILDPAFASQYAYLIYEFVRGAEDFYSGKLKDFSQVGFRKIDDRTLQVTLWHPTPYLLKIIASNPCWTAVPVKVLAKYGPLDQKGTAWTRPGNLVSSGPYLLKSWVPNQNLVVVRNPEYWDAARPKLDEIDFLPIDDLDTEERMFRTGEIDVTYDMPFTKVDVYRREHPEELQIEPWYGVYYYECNVNRPPLTDARVRRALALSIDRDRLVRDVTRGGQQPALSISYPGAGYVPGATLVPDVVEARRLLAEAGFPGGRGFPHLELLYNTLQQHRQIAEAIQAMWRENLGIELTLRNEEWKVYLDAEHTHDFQLSRAGWIADYVDPQVFFELWETHNGNNFTGWSDPAYDRLFHEALLSKTDAQRFAVFHEMDKILVDQCPVIPIYYYTRTYAMNPRIRGWWPTLLDDPPWKYVYWGN